MKKLFILLLVVVISEINLVAQDTPANCELAAIVVADGVADEWPLTWIPGDDKKFSYNVCSDNDNIYIRMKTNDDMTRRKIGYFGLTVWLDTNGKKKRKLGLHFPSGVEAKERMDALRASEDQRKNYTAVDRDQFQKEINRTIIENLEILELIGLAERPLTSTRSGITNGLKVAIAAEEDGTYVYEAVIPFKAYRLSKAAISEMAVGFETGKYDPPKVKNSGSSNPSMGSGMGGGYGAGYGGMGGGMGGGGGYRGPSSPFMTSTSFWVFVKFK